MPTRPPPPPPLPPHLSHTHPAPKPLPRSTPSTTSATHTPKSSNQLFTPFPIFLYGTLRDPSVMSSLLSLPTPPEMRNACIKGFKVKMWGIYPTLLPSPNLQAAVHGSLFWLENAEHWRRLEEYETSAYTWCTCSAIFLNADGSEGERVEECRAFCWTGEEASTELEDGEFDLERWQRYFRSSVVREL